MTEPTGRPPTRAGLIGPFSARQILVFLVIVLAAGGLLAFITSPISPPDALLPSPGATFYVIGTPTEGLKPGDVAPELEGVVDGKTVGLTGLDGRPIRLADLRGRPVWLTFFATWCPPCQQETPVLRDAYEAHRDQGLELVAVSVQETTAGRRSDLRRDLRARVPHRLRRLLGASLAPTRAMACRPTSSSTAPARSRTSGGGR